MRSTRVTLLTWLATALVLGAPSAAREDTYPSKPIKLIVASAAGGPLDIVARAVADKLSESLKQPVLVESKAGAGGNLAADIVGKSPPDGYTLLLLLSTTLSVNPALYKNLSFNLKPITIVNTATQMMVVHPSVPANTLAELVAYAKKQPLVYAHAGPGSGGHLAMEYFRTMAGFDTVQVPYRGNAPLVVDLLAGQVKAGFVATGGVIQHVRDGKLRGLAISSTTRSSLAPDVPTTAEAGYPDFKLGSYFVLLGPAGLPDAVAGLLEREVRDALTSPELHDKFAAQDIVVIGSSAAEAREFLRTDTALWARIAKDANLRVD
jgi:tripartite-type tricarboxylate transporter receptor subunit TctC